MLKVLGILESYMDKKKQLMKLCEKMLVSINSKVPLDILIIVVSDVYVKPKD